MIKERLSKLKINVLSKTQYDSIQNKGKNELYFVEDNNPEIEEGTVTNRGYYIKFPNGTLIQWYWSSVDVSSGGAWGSMYSYPVTFPNFPIAFIGIPSVHVNFQTTGSNGWISSMGESGKVTEISPGGWQIVRPTEASSVSGRVSYFAIGRWK